MNSRKENELLIFIHAATAVLFCIALPHIVIAQENPENVTTEQISSNLYDIQLKKIEGPFEGYFGAIALLGNEVLVATVNGTLFVVSENYEISDMPLRIPVDREDFDFAIPDDLEDSYGAEAFGVKDIYLHGTENAAELYASHSYWNASKECAGLRLSMISLSIPTRLADAQVKTEWKTLYDSQPCLPLKDSGLHTHAGHQAGGRVWVLPDGDVLLTIGDHEYDGLNGDNLVHDPSTSYGKIIKLDRGAWSAKTFSMGHRNPQGLYVSPAGQIWSTEHGPQGGDELNLLDEGQNYGWPFVTYGVDYDSKTWPLSERQGSHAGYKLPIYAWVPSIGISNLIGIEKQLFDLWKGDLIVSSMLYETLYRLRLMDGRAVLAEPIWLGHRIRDIAEAIDGTIVLKTDDDLLIFMSPAPSDPG